MNIITTDDLPPYYGPISERTLKDGGNEYVLRDVFEDGIFQRCEYATMNKDGSKLWHTCREGSRFDEIEPFKVIHG